MYGNEDIIQKKISYYISGIAAMITIIQKEKQIRSSKEILKKLESLLKKREEYCGKWEKLITDTVDKQFVHMDDIAYRDYLKYREFWDTFHPLRNEFFEAVKRERKK